MLSRKFADGSERPLAYASRSLNSVEENYSQLDREALSIIFGVKWFHIYLYGRKFLLQTDHKSLLSILGPHSDLSSSENATVGEQDLLLWGRRVIIPSQLRERVYQLLHENHKSLSRMKSVARSYVWWPAMIGFSSRPDRQKLRLLHLSPLLSSQAEGGYLAHSE